MGCPYDLPDGVKNAAELRDIIQASADGKVAQAPAVAPIGAQAANGCAEPAS
jgi:hypothetical protein